MHTSAGLMQLIGSPILHSPLAQRETHLAEKNQKNQSIFLFLLYARSTLIASNLALCLESLYLSVHQVVCLFEDFTHVGYSVHVDAQLLSFAHQEGCSGLLDRRAREPLRRTCQDEFDLLWTHI